MVPVALILLGLLFAAAGLTDGGSAEPPDRDAAPATVVAVFDANAQPWATSQVGAAVTTVVTSVDVVGASATGATTFSARAVIVRHDAAAQPSAAAGEPVPTLAEADTSTVATCVLWDVDATAGASTPRAAVELVRSVGHHDLGDIADADDVRDRCRDAILPG